MDALVNSLPIRQAGDKAKLVVVNTRGSIERNVCSKATVATAKNKGWKILDYANGYYTPYEGSETEDENHIKLKTNKPIGAELTFYAVALNPIDIEGAEVLEIDNTKLRLKVLQPEIIIKGDLMNFAAQKSSLTSADVKSNLLVSLWLDENDLENINLNGNSTIQVLNVEKNKLKSLDVTQMINLEELACGRNMLSKLDLSNSANLKTLSCENNKIESFDFSKTPLIGSITCFGNKINTSNAKQLFESLPQCQTIIHDNKGVIFFVDSHNTEEGNAAFKKDVQIGKNKNYDVRDYIGGIDGSQGKPYEGIEDATELKLYVGGVKVTADNAGDVLGDGGTVIYDMNTKTLTLNNAQFISPENSGGIANSSVDDLTIILVGNNSITTQGSYTGLGLSRRTKIIGDGKLVINSNGSGGIYINKTQLTVKDCSIDITGKAGIVGYNGKSGEKLVIDNATVKVNGSMGAIFMIEKFDLSNNCEIVSPQGAFFDETSRSIMIDEGGKHKLVKGEVIIAPISSGVENVFVNKNVDSNNRWYDLQGREVQKPSQGIYIHNGKKILVK